MSKRRRKIVIYIEKDGALSLFHADVIQLKKLFKGCSNVIKKFRNVRCGRIDIILFWYRREILFARDYSISFRGRTYLQNILIKIMVNSNCNVT